MQAGGGRAKWADEDWGAIKAEMPEGWEEAARVFGAIRISKGPLADPEVLLRLLLGHVSTSGSLRQTAGFARNSGLVDVSDVALFERLRKSADWFEWMINEVLEQPLRELPDAPYRLRLVDATCCSKPASVGTDFRVHTAISLPERAFTRVEVTGAKGGESFGRIPLEPGDLVVGDRLYGIAKEIEYVRSARAQILVRVNVSSLPLFRRDESRVDLLEEARTLAPGESKELAVFAHLPGGGLEPGRLCVHALTEEQALRSQRRMTKKKGKKQKRPKAASIESARYVFIFTTLPKSVVSLEGVFAVYRLRWQIELAFKTLKQVAGVGRVPHRLEETGRAWLLGKVLCALIVQRLAARREAFPP